MIRLSQKQVPLICVLLISAVLFSGCESPGKNSTVTETKPSRTKSIELSDLDQNYYRKALDHIDNGYFKKALKPLQKLDKKYPFNVGIKINLASSYLSLGRLDNAESVTEQALKTNNTIAELHNVLGLIAIERKRFRKAETEYLLAVTLDKNLANAHFNAALLYDIYFQDIPKAYTYYSNYLLLVPDDQNVKDWLDQLKYSLEQEL